MEAPAGRLPDPQEVRRMAEQTLDTAGKTFPKSYISALTKHLRDCPYENNFIAELKGGNGFGIVTCMEDLCWKDVLMDADPDLPDGGKADGFGSFFNYQTHCGESKHIEGRDARRRLAGMLVENKAVAIFGPVEDPGARTPSFNARETPSNGVALPPDVTHAMLGTLSLPVDSTQSNTALIALLASSTSNRSLAAASLDEYDDGGYENDRPRTQHDLQEFFASALDDWSEDSDVEGALKMLGMESLNDKFKGLEINLMAHQVLGVAFMLEKERNRKFRGGILADAMGIGKTIQTLGVIVGNRWDKKLKTTLIVAPLALLSQWKTEIETRTTGPLRVLIHHGHGRTKSTNQLRHFDVVMTTYGTLSSEHGAEVKKKVKPKREQSVDSFVSLDEEIVIRKKGPLFRNKFLRVVLDEAHLIRNRNTKAAKAAWDLEAEYRWSLTGTLVVNNLDDVFSHLRFLSISPSASWDHFRAHISSAQKRKPKVATKRVQAILKTCSLRRHKESLLNGKRLLELPPKTTEIDELDFTEEERATYVAIETRAKIKFNSFLKKGSVMKNMACVLTLLLRLRQLTCHPYLIRRNPGDPMHPNDLLLDDDELFGEAESHYSLSADDLSEVDRATTLLGQAFVDKVKRFLVERSARLIFAVKTDDEEGKRDGECSICMDMLTDERVCGPCAHSFCSTCVDDLFNRPATDVDLADDQVQRGVRMCPMCRAPIEKGKIFRASVFEEPEPEVEDAKPNVKDEVAYAAMSSTLPKSLGKKRAIDAEDVKTLFKKAKPEIKGKAKAEPDEVDELDDDEDMAGIDQVLPSTKMKHMGDLVDGFLEEDATNKILIFSQFTSYIELCSIFLRRRGVTHLCYVGSMKQPEREEVVKAFNAPSQHPKAPRVLLISLKCGGVGLNLTAACKCVMMDLAWNCATENQAVDRAHRIGQTKPVEVRRLVIRNTVEQRILALQQEKAKLADGAMGEGDGGRLGRLSVQDLIRLFGMDE